ncbi:hypothetical protein GY45DRAFT_518927 [Cubamyces sp. BRFM 1775]|nr:hypothetical protein GY45DRAFT_518927 [Cubamyces sp. BRFM 1775]
MHGSLYVTDSITPHPYFFVKPICTAVLWPYLSAAVGIMQYSLPSMRYRYDTLEILNCFFITTTASFEISLNVDAGSVDGTRTRSACFRLSLGRCNSKGHIPLGIDEVPSRR